jgi:hypothetical protein
MIGDRSPNPFQRVLHVSPHLNRGRVGAKQLMLDRLTNNLSQSPKGSTIAGIWYDSFMNDILYVSS